MGKINEEVVTSATQLYRTGTYAQIHDIAETETGAEVQRSNNRIFITVNLTKD